MATWVARPGGKSWWSRQEIPIASSSSTSSSEFTFCDKFVHPHKPVKMKWRTTSFLFVSWALLCLAAALNETEATTEAPQKDANETINTKALTDPITGSGRSFIEPLMGGFDGVGGYSGGTGGFPLGSGVVAGLAIPALIAGILILLFDIFSRPFLASGVARASDSFFGGGFTGIAEYMLTFVENSLDHVPTIDGEECIKRSVCEAHSNPKKYGIIALPLQLLFPPYPYTGMDDTSKISKYQLAARYGKNENANCGAQYHSCVVNPLELITSFARMITDI